MAQSDETRGRESNPAEGKRTRAQSKSRDALNELGTTMGKVTDGLADTRDRLDSLEQIVENLESGVAAQGKELQELIHSSTHPIEDNWRQGQEAFEAKILGILETMQQQMDLLQSGLEDAKGDISLCKRAAACGIGSLQGTVHAPRVEAPKPKAYSGKRNAKELDDYFWQIERYFEAIGLRNEPDKVNTVTLYLSDHALSWWRRKHAEIQKGLCTIDTWGALQQELKRQFYSENVSYDARKRMKELKQNKSIAEYVEEFSGLILQVPNMSDEDLLFNFYEGLQPWAFSEIKRRDVKDIATALTVAETLVDFCKGDAEKPKHQHKPNNGGRAWDFRP